MKIKKVKRYSNKELQSMTPEEGKKLVEECMELQRELGEQIRAILENGSKSTKGNEEE